MANTIGRDVTVSFEMAVKGIMWDECRHVLAENASLKKEIKYLERELAALRAAQTQSQCIQCPLSTLTHINS